MDRSYGPGRPCHTDDPNHTPKTAVWCQPYELFETYCPGHPLISTQVLTVRIASEVG